MKPQVTLGKCPECRTQTATTATYVGLGVRVGAGIVGSTTRHTCTGEWPKACSRV